MRKLFQYFSVGEWLLWGCSCLAILVCFFLFGGSGALSLIASLVGVTSLIFCAKGNPAGQVLMILFSLVFFLYRKFVIPMDNAHQKKGRTSHDAGNCPCVVARIETAGICSDPNKFPLFFAICVAQ